MISPRLLSLFVFSIHFSIFDFLLNSLHFLISFAPNLIQDRLFYSCEFDRSCSKLYFSVLMIWNSFVFFKIKMCQSTPWNTLKRYYIMITVLKTFALSIQGGPGQIDSDRLVQGFPDFDRYSQNCLRISGLESELLANALKTWMSKNYLSLLFSGWRR